MTHTLKYFFSFWFLFFIICLHGQETSKTKTAQSIITNKSVVAEKNVAPIAMVKDSIAKDSIVKTDRYGVRVGIDLFKLTRGLYDEGYKGIEFTGDYRLSKRYFLAAELGNENKTTQDDRLNTTTKGSYIKVGFDYNAYENWLNMENIISIGLRYGASTFSQELNSYKIYYPNQYWGEIPWVQSGEKFDGLSASWLEVVAGLKVKLFNNVFAGFSLQLHVLVSDKKPSDNFENLYIPGFNRTYDGNFGAGFNYTVSYFIPIYKKKIKLETPKPKK